MRGPHRGALTIGWLVSALIGCGSEEPAPYVDTGGPSLRPAASGSSSTSSDDVPGDPDDEPTAGSASAGSSAPDAGGDTDSTPVPSGAALSVVEMRDEAGDADSWPGMLRYPLDLVSVEVETASDELRVRYQFARPLAEHFAFPGVDGERTGGAPAELYLDLDDDPSTGVEPFWASESAWSDELVGYEAELDLLLGFDFVTKSDGSEGSAGGDAIIDSDEVEITGHYADYWLLDHTADMRLGPDAADGGFDPALPDTRPLTTIEGEVIELRVPLAWLDLGSGDVVRLMYRENDQGPASGQGYSHNARLRVR